MHSPSSQHHWFSILAPRQGSMPYASALMLEILHKAGPGLIITHVLIVQYALHVWVASYVFSLVLHIMYSVTDGINEGI